MSSSRPRNTGAATRLAAPVVLASVIAFALAGCSEPMTDSVPSPTPWLQDSDGFVDDGDPARFVLVSDVARAAARDHISLSVTTEAGGSVLRISSSEPREGLPVAIDLQESDVFSRSDASEAFIRIDVVPADLSSGWQPVVQYLVNVPSGTVSPTP